MTGEAVSPARAAVRVHGVQERAQELVEMARAWGLVLTIEQRPLKPLAMGHHQTVVSVRPARGHR